MLGIRRESERYLSEREKRSYQANRTRGASCRFRKWHQARLIVMRERGRARAPNEERGSERNPLSERKRGGEARRGENHRGLPRGGVLAR